MALGGVLADDLLTTTQRQVDRVTETFLVKPALVNLASLQQSRRTMASAADQALVQGGTYVPGNNMTAGENSRVYLPVRELGVGDPGRHVYDNYFTTAMLAFRGVDGAFTINAMYVGFANGDMAGAEVRAPNTRNSEQLGAQFSDTPSAPSQARRTSPRPMALSPRNSIDGTSAPVAP